MTQNCFNEINKIVFIFIFGEKDCFPVIKQTDSSISFSVPVLDRNNYNIILEGAFPTQLLKSIAKIKEQLNYRSFVFQSKLCNIFVSNLQYVPAFTTACVCLEVPDAMFVKAQAASNCKDGLKNEKKYIH